MPGFLYFVESVEPVTRERIAGWGLAHAFEEVPTNFPLQGATPSGTSGTLLYREQDLAPFTPRYLPEEQTWRRFPNSGERKAESGNSPAWVGYYNEGKPGPADLARLEQVPGVPLRLADGHSWQVPLVRFPLPGGGRGTLLPAYVDCDEFGEPIAGEVLEKYAPLASIAERFWLAWNTAFMAAAALGREEFEFDCDTIVADACLTLAANYRISLAEVMLLKLFRTGTASAVMSLACNLDRAKQLLETALDPQKKSPPLLTSDRSPTDAGAAA